MDVRGEGGGAGDLERHHGGITTQGLQSWTTAPANSACTGRGAQAFDATPGRYPRLELSEGDPGAGADHFAGETGFRRVIEANTAAFVEDASSPGIKGPVLQEQRGGISQPGPFATRLDSHQSIT